MLQLKKQDRQGARTPADIERRYDFDKRFNYIEASLEKTLGYNDNGEIISIINAAANQITITSDNFRLLADGHIWAKSAFIAGEIEALSGIVGGWDISEERIYKETDKSIVSLYSPQSDSEGFFVVERVEDGAVTDTPLLIRANGDIFTRGIVESSDALGIRTTRIDKGTIFIDGEWGENDMTEGVKTIPLMQFTDPYGNICELYVTGTEDEAFGFYPSEVKLRRVM